MKGQRMAIKIFGVQTGRKMFAPRCTACRELVLMKTVAWRGYRGFRGRWIRAVGIRPL